MASDGSPVAMNEPERGLNALATPQHQFDIATEEVARPVAPRPFLRLTDQQLEAARKHGEAHLWDTRRDRGMPWKKDVFEFVAETYADWIPGLTQGHLKHIDISLYRRITREISLRGGRPDGFDVPPDHEARDRIESDPRRKIHREMERERQRLAYQERPAKRGPAPFPKLTDEQIAAAREHGEAHLWDTRRDRGMPWKKDVFEFVSETYAAWIPGLTQGHLKHIDLYLYRKLTREIFLRGGRPAGFDVPPDYEGKDRSDPDPRRRIHREIERERIRCHRAQRYTPK
jgi:hypothetical protein